MLAEFLFKKRFETKKVLNLIRWSIIIYAIITWGYLLVSNIIYSESFMFIKSYELTHWIMLSCALILPFTLFVKKLASNFLYILFVAIFMKIGFYLERFIIFVTTFFRNDSSGNGNSDFINSYLFTVLIVFIQGVIIAIIALGIFEIIKRRKT